MPATINELMAEIHINALYHGWWNDSRSFGDIIALCHSELSEAFEEYRNGRDPQESNRGAQSFAFYPKRIYMDPDFFTKERAESAILDRAELLAELIREEGIR